MKENKALDFTPVLFPYHTHVELLAGNPDQIVYRERDVIQILMDCIAFCVRYGRASAGGPVLSAVDQNKLILEASIGFIDTAGGQYLQSKVANDAFFWEELRRLEKLKELSQLTPALEEKLRLYKRFEKHYSS